MPVLEVTFGGTGFTHAITPYLPPQERDDRR